MVANVLPATPNPLTLGIRSKVTFSELGHIAYLTKGNHKMFLPTLPHLLTLGDGFNRSKVNFSKHGHVAYQIKGNHKLLLQTPLTPLPWGMGSIGLKSTFSENGHVAYQIKGNHKFLLHTPTPNPGVGFKGSKFHFFRILSCCISNERE